MHGNMFSTCFPNEPMVNLAEKLAHIMPRALKKLGSNFLQTSGTEANENAIQVVRMHTGGFGKLWCCAMPTVDARPSPAG